jgi:hypothetical protein
VQHPKQPCNAAIFALKAATEQRFRATPRGSATGLKPLPTNHLELHSHRALQQRSALFQFEAANSAPQADVGRFGRLLYCMLWFF